MLAGLARRGDGCGEGACPRWGAKRPQAASTVRLMNLSAFMGDCYAVERGQAPSPQKQ